jgi:hypothetical protein
MGMLCFAIKCMRWLSDVQEIVKFIDEQSKTVENLTPPYVLHIGLKYFSYKSFFFSLRQKSRNWTDFLACHRQICKNMKNIF